MREQPPVAGAVIAGPAVADSGVAGAALADVKIGTPPHPAVAKLRLVTVVAVLAFFFVGVPGLNAAGVVPDYKVQLLGKYLCFALVALGADLIWGYTGLLSLCQALFFCLGGYAVAMHLSLPQGGGIYETPQFLSFVYYGPGKDPLPPFWKLFQSGFLAVALGLAVSTALAAAFAFFIFRSRVRGVYFSIVTQAVAWGTWLLISQNEMLLGGTNGLTNFSKSFSQEHGWIVWLYLLTVACVAGGYLLCRAVVRSRAGRVMVAIRDREMRLYFAGYKPYAFKVFAFTLAAGLGAVGGMLYPAQVGIITPQDTNVAASIYVVIMVAVGGRGRLWGAVYGAVLVTTAQSMLSSDLPKVWPFIYGGMFVAVVLFFPDGFVGLWDRVERAIEERAGALALAAAAVPVVAVTAFVLAEALGLMPDALQAELVAVGGMSAAKILVLLAVLFVVFANTREMDVRPRYVLRIAAGVGGLAYAVLLVPPFADSFAVRWKYVALVAVLALAAALSFAHRRTAARAAALARGGDADGVSPAVRAVGT